MTKTMMIDVINMGRKYHNRSNGNNYNDLTNKLSDGLAIELEVELDPNKILPDYGCLGFRTTPDGSLRNFGVEYVSDSPKPYKAVSKDLSSLLTVVKALDKYNMDKEASRTGLHVHGNTLNRSLLQVLTTISTYWLVESILSPMCGSHREGNLFCLRAKDAQGQVGILTKGILDIRKGRGLLDHFNERSLKYSGLNLYTLVKFGSLEFRLMKGLIEEDRQLSWLNICNTLMYELPFETPSEVLDTYWKHREDPRQFFDLVFKDNEYLNNFLDKQWADKDKFKKEMKENAKRLLTLCYLSKGDKDSWEKILKHKIKEPKKKKNSLYAPVLINPNVAAPGRVITFNTE